MFIVTEYAALILFGKIKFSRKFTNLRELSKKFVEFVNKTKSTSVVVLKFLHV